MVQAHQPWLRRVVALLSPSAVHVIAAATLQLRLVVDAEEQGECVRSAVLILTRPMQGEQQAVRAVRRRLARVILDSGSWCRNCPNAASQKAA
jgi:hypothetical protein